MKFWQDRGIINAEMESAVLFCWALFTIFPWQTVWLSTLVVQHISGKSP
ncbi:hypothetical protein AAULR_19231, partial [Lacticaseibacillus rhamnosus MTCC 5462]